MKDFLGNELAIGDHIVYTTRRSSSLNLREAFVFRVDYDVPKTYSRDTYDRVLVKRVHNKREKEWKKKGWGKFKEFVYLSCPQYIVKIASNG